MGEPSSVPPIQSVDDPVDVADECLDYVETKSGGKWVVVDRNHEKKNATPCDSHSEGPGPCVSGERRPLASNEDRGRAVAYKKEQQ